MKGKKSLERIVKEDLVRNLPKLGLMDADASLQDAKSDLKILVLCNRYDNLLFEDGGYLDAGRRATAFEVALRGASEYFPILAAAIDKLDLLDFSTEASAPPSDEEEEEEEGDDLSDVIVDAETAPWSSRVERPEQPSLAEVLLAVGATVLLWKLARSIST